MKCANCECEWTLSSKIKIILRTCPFCGTSLETTMVSVKEALRWAVNTYGTEVFQNDVQMNSLLADMAYKEEKERTKIRQALYAGAGKWFLQILERNDGVVCEDDSRAFRRKMEEFDFTPAFSLYVLNAFLYAVSLPEISDDLSVDESVGERQIDGGDSIKQPKKNKLILISQKQTAIKRDPFVGKKVGDIIQLGDGIEWIFLYKDKKEICLLSRYLLASGQYYPLIDEFKKKWLGSIGEELRIRVRDITYPNYVVLFRCFNYLPNNLAAKDEKSSRKGGNSHFGSMPYWVSTGEDSPVKKVITIDGKLGSLDWLSEAGLRPMVTFKLS